MSELLEWLRDARARTLALVRDLDEEQLLGPRLTIVNPLLWEIGHVAWFQEKWILRHALGRDPIRADGDSLYDSAAIPHDVRWDLPLPDRAGTLAYLTEVLRRAIAALETGELEERLYFVKLALFHEDMHGEAIFYTRQTLGHPAPEGVGPAITSPVAVTGGGDLEVPGGSYWIGARPGTGFVFDNEKWAHPVELPPFRIARNPVTQGEYAEFVEKSGAELPVYWRRGAGPGPGGFERRLFDHWVPLEPHLPVLHVNAFEAEAYCRWAGRRLPSEAEREVSGLPPGGAWEWTSTRFSPYPGFVPDPYREYSEPWFHSDHRVLRGGAFVTKPRLLRKTWRNFYTPDRRDVWAGFRTCAL